MSVCLAGIAVTVPTKSGAKAKPLLPDPTAELDGCVRRAIKAQRDKKAAEASLESEQGVVKEAVLNHAFTSLAGRTEIEDTFELRTTEGKAAVSMQNRYTVPTKEPALGQARALLGAYLKDVITLKIDLDQMPPEYQQVFVDGVVALANDLGELSGNNIAAAVSATVVPTILKTFHEERYTRFTAEENKRIHELVPCTVVMKLDY